MDIDQKKKKRGPCMVGMRKSGEYEYFSGTVFDLRLKGIWPFLSMSGTGLSSWLISNENKRKLTGG